MAFMIPLAAMTIGCFGLGYSFLVWRRYRRWPTKNLIVMAIAAALAAILLIIQ
jgi:hypothetical protein